MKDLLKRILGRGKEPTKVLQEPAVDLSANNELHKRGDEIEAPNQDQCKGDDFANEEKNEGFVRVRLEQDVRMMILMARESVGGKVIVLKVEFEDGSVLNKVRRLDGYTMLLPKEFAGKPIKSVLVPLDQTL